MPRAASTACTEGGSIRQRSRGVPKSNSKVQLHAAPARGKASWHGGKSSNAHHAQAALPGQLGSLLGALGGGAQHVVERAIGAVLCWLQWVGEGGVGWWGWWAATPSPLLLMRKWHPLPGRGRHAQPPLPPAVQLAPVTRQGGSMHRPYNETAWEGRWAGRRADLQGRRGTKLVCQAPHSRVAAGTGQRALGGVPCEECRFPHQCWGASSCTSWPPPASKEARAHGSVQGGGVGRGAELLARPTRSSGTAANSLRCGRPARLKPYKPTRPGCTARAGACRSVPAAGQPSRPGAAPASPWPCPLQPPSAAGGEAQWQRGQRRRSYWA